jgi:hypothetical protein
MKRKRDQKKVNPSIIFILLHFLVRGKAKTEKTRQNEGKNPGFSQKSWSRVRPVKGRNYGG